MPQNFDARQTESRDTLSQMEPNVVRPLLDSIIRSADSDLTPPLRVDAAATPSLTVTVGSGTISNPESQRQRSMPQINGILPTFAGGTVTFPAFNGGTITVSPGVNQTLILPVNSYAKVLLALDTTGNIVVVVGGAGGSPSTASVPPPNTNTLPFAYIVLFNNAGTVQNITQNTIFQFDKGFVESSSSPSGSGNGFAGNLTFAMGATVASFNFPSAQPDLSYVVLTTMQNLVDVNPQELIVINIEKTVNGFTVLLNSPTDSANYSVNYIVPQKAFQAGEKSIPDATSSQLVTLGIPDNGPSYGLVAFLQDTTDLNPEFQPLVITAQTATDFTATFNSPTDSPNYQVVWLKAATAQTILSLGATSVDIDLPIAYGTSNYAVVAMMYNLVDPTPQFQPLVITTKASGDFTLSWSAPTDSGNYKIVYYAISFS